MAQRNSLLVAVCLTAVLVAGFASVTQGQGQSNAPDTTLEGLVKEKAILFLRGEFPISDRREIVQLHGTIRAVTDQGLWLESINRQFKNERATDDTTAYTGTLFVPWSSISYLKLIREE